jgi:hypothetical protein
VTINQSGANLTALKAINAERETPIKIRQRKYLNHIVEQDHRAIKRRTRPMLGFKKFGCARMLLNGIELMHMINKGQMKNYGLERTPAQQFYALVASNSHHISLSSPRHSYRDSTGLVRLVGFSSSGMILEFGPSATDLPAGME